MTNSRWIIVTTINPPTPAIEALAQLAPAWKLLVVADKKTPSSWSYPGATFLSLDDQASLGFQLSAHAPFNHYARKNIGYLFALRAGAEVILETDDDNLPYDTYPGVISQSVEGRLVQKKNWENVYTHFSPSRIWPRGFPLEFINDSLRQKSHLSPKSTHECDIQQYLADDNPDVDAVFRLTNEGAEFFSGEDVVLGPGSWCPFNSQNTLWWPPGLPVFISTIHCKLSYDRYLEVVCRARLCLRPEWEHCVQRTYDVSEAQRAQFDSRLCG